MRIDLITLKKLLIYENTIRMVKTQRFLSKIKILTLLLYAIGRKEEGKYQESIQANTTPDPGHYMGKCQKHKKTQHTREPRDQPFPSR